MRSNSSTAAGTSPSRRTRIAAMLGGARRRQHAGDARERAQFVDLDVVDAQAQPEVLLELRQQLDELERVEDAALQQVGVGRRHLDVELLYEQGAQALDDLLRVAAHAAASACCAS